MGSLFDEGELEWKDCQTLGVGSVVNFKLGYFQCGLSHETKNLFSVGKQL